MAPTTLVRLLSGNPNICSHGNDNRHGFPAKSHPPYSVMMIMGRTDRTERTEIETYLTITSEAFAILQSCEVFQSQLFLLPNHPCQFWFSSSLYICMVGICHCHIMTDGTGGNMTVGSFLLQLFEKILFCMLPNCRALQEL